MQDIDLLPVSISYAPSKRKMRHGTLAAGYFQNYNFEVNVMLQHTYVCMLQ